MKPFKYIGHVCVNPIEKKSSSSELKRDLRFEHNKVGQQLNCKDDLHWLVILSTEYYYFTGNIFFIGHNIGDCQCKVCTGLYLMLNWAHFMLPVGAVTQTELFIYFYPSEFVYTDVYKAVFDRPENEHHSCDQTENTLCTHCTVKF